MNASSLSLLNTVELDNLSLLCISSIAPSYVLAESFNHIFRTEFEQIDEFFLTENGKIVSKNFPMYQSVNTVEYTTWFLVKNKHNNSILISSLRNVDYFLVVIGNNHSAWSKSIISCRSWFPQHTNILPYDFRKKEPTSDTATQLSFMGTPEPPKTRKRTSPKEKSIKDIVNLFLPCIWECYVCIESNEDILAGKIREEWKKNGYSALSKSLPYNNYSNTEIK